jgi:CheY-like chemotaxis protein
VVGFVDLLLETDLDPVQRDYAEGVRRAGEALMDLIDDILDFSKVESGKLELEEVELDLEQLVEEVVQLAVEEAHGKGLEIVGYCHPDMPIVLRGDSGRLRQILLNLVSNAVKFTSEGHVVVTADLAGWRGADALVRLEVRDTGIGIPAHERTRLFEPFSQGDASTTRRYGGTGLGLAISRQLAEAMGGAITLESETGRGSTFRVTIPLAPTTDPEGPRRAARGALGGARVLVAGTGGMAGAALESQLAAWGMRPEPAYGASACLRCLAEAAEAGAPFHLVFADVDLPDMSSPEALRQLTDQARAAGTSVVLLSGARLPDAPSLGRLGAAACLPKPVRLSRLHDTLVRLLAARPGAGLLGTARTGGAHRQARGRGRGPRGGGQRPQPGRGHAHPRKARVPGGCGEHRSRGDRRPAAQDVRGGAHGLPHARDGRLPDDAGDPPDGGRVPGARPSSPSPPARWPLTASDASPPGWTITWRSRSGSPGWVKPSPLGPGIIARRGGLRAAVRGRRMTGDQPPSVPFGCQMPSWAAWRT